MDNIKIEDNAHSDENHCPFNRDAMLLCCYTFRNSTNAHAHTPQPRAKHVGEHDVQLTRVNFLHHRNFLRNMRAENYILHLQPLGTFVCYIDRYKNFHNIFCM